MADVLALLGLGGLAGALAGLVAAGLRLSRDVAEARSAIENALRDPRRANLDRVVAELRDVESDLKTVAGLVKRLVRG